MNDEKQQHLRVAAYGVITRRDEILLCRLSQQVMTWAGMWTLPGGGLDFGEHPEEGMVREVMEETGLDVRPVEVIGVDAITGEREDVSWQSLRILYAAEVLSGTLRHEAQGTTDMCQWHPIDRLDDIGVVDLVNTGIAMLSAKGR